MVFGSSSLFALVLPTMSTETTSQTNTHTHTHTHTHSLSLSLSLSLSPSLPLSPLPSLPLIVWLLLLLSHFSRVWLCATPETAAHQAPLSLGFSRQDHWSGLPFPSPMHESEKWKWSRSIVSLCPTPSDPMDCSLPGSSIHGIFQARVLEWVAIAFSNGLVTKGQKIAWGFNPLPDWSALISLLLFASDPIKLQWRATRLDDYLSALLRYN